MFQRPNLLVIDEPTNHLDIDTREALAEALQDFAGAVVLVAHDRGLLRAVCDDYLLVRDGRLQPFDGDLDDYAKLVLRRTPADSPAPNAGDSRRDARRDRAGQRARVAPLEERSRAHRETARRARSRTRRRAGRARRAGAVRKWRWRAHCGFRRRQGQLAQEIAALENAWLEAHAALEGADRG